MAARPIALFIVTVVGALLLAPTPASARARRGYWFGEVAATLELPQATLASGPLRYRRALGSELRIGYTSRSGPGLSFDFGYAPLPREDIDAGRVDNHVVTAEVVPRFTFGRGAIRARWGLGGGLFAERTTVTPELRDRLTKSGARATAVITAALEAYLFEGAALSVGISYRRVFGVGNPEWLALESGLVLTFP